MNFKDQLAHIQEDLHHYNLTGWLLYDFKGINKLASKFLQMPIQQFLTRRLFYWIPAEGTPLKIVSVIEPNALSHLPGDQILYKTWEDLEKQLSKIFSSKSTIAMEYSPLNAIPVVSCVDAGTIELVKKTGANIVSSAHLLQKYTSTWTEEQLKTHLEAAEALQHVAEEAWNYLSHKLTAKESLTEYDLQQFMLEAIKKRNCITDHAPIVAVNEHSSDPHYNPEKESAFAIKRGDYILLDLWCKKNETNAVYADITRVGVIADSPTPRQQQVFDIVQGARDYATNYIMSKYQKGEPLVAWQVDRICRDYIIQAGFGEYFTHRTGHNIGEQVHGQGANLDNYETHDYRELIANTCFSVEPGIYLPNEFGVRLEYDVYLDKNNTVRITGGIQQEIICITG